MAAEAASMSLSSSRSNARLSFLMLDGRISSSMASSLSAASGASSVVEEQEAKEQGSKSLPSTASTNYARGAETKGVPRS